MTILACNKLRIQFGNRLILSDLTFSIDEPQFIGVFGPNGAGKTSFMKTILGILPVQQGTLKIFGKHPRQVRKEIAYIPQYQNMDSFHLTGRSFIASSVHGNRLGLPFLTRKDHQEIDRVLDDVEARDLADLSLMEMSGGQKQRILLAQALLGEPRFIILDEPFNNLDPKWVKVILALIKNIQQERKISVLLSTHDLNPLIHVMNQVLCIGNQSAILGKVQDVITAKTLTKLYGFPIQVIKANNTCFVTTSFN